eukprot:Rhum_TRINITY_DN7692_c0_g1::Rhum_TRINITY_DN7692_c0_g1_i1::g.24219::m.24219/K16465/CETN1; centrin-1
MSNLTEHQLRDTFDLFDADGSGAVDVSEMGLVMEALGFGKLPASDLEDLVRQLDRDGSGVVQYEDLRRVARAKAAPRNSPQEVDAAFASFDKGGKGRITVDDFCDVAERLAVEVRPELYREIIREAAGEEGEGVTLEQWVGIHKEVNTDKHRKAGPAPQVVEY